MIQSTSSEWAANLGVVWNTGEESRLATTIPWGSAYSGQPLVAGTYRLSWANFDAGPIDIGTIEITSPGAVPAPVGPAFGALPVLRAGGIGALDFGADRATVIAYLTELIGMEPGGDPQWDDQLSFGSLEVRFDDPMQPDGTTRELWTRWAYSAGGMPNLSTVEGVGIGSSVGDLLESFPEPTFGDCLDGLSAGSWYGREESVALPGLSGPDINVLAGQLDRDAGQIGAAVVSLFGGQDPNC